MNLKNDSVRYVKVNDRLPKSSRHIIDVSYGTAKQLNFIKINNYGNIRTNQNFGRVINH